MIDDGAGQRHAVSATPASSLCLGTWAFGGAWGEVTERMTTRIVYRALDLGITSFDTAATYGNGRAEERLATALAPVIRQHRDEVTLATKGGLSVRGTGRTRRVVRDSRPASLRTSLVESLRRLGTDHVDVYYVHWPDPLVDAAEVGATMAALVDEGLTRSVGVSNFSADQMRGFLQGGPIDVVQLPYNLLSREIEVDRLPLAQQVGAQVYGWSPLFHGLLAGSLGPSDGFAHDDWRGTDSRFAPAQRERIDRWLSPLRERADREGRSLATFAVAWLLDRGVTPVVGCQTPDELDDLAAALEVAAAGAVRDLDRLLGPGPDIAIEDGANISGRR